MSLVDQFLQDNDFVTDLDKKYEEDSNLLHSSPEEEKIKPKNKNIYNFYNDSNSESDQSPPPSKTKRREEIKNEPAEEQESQFVPQKAKPIRKYSFESSDTDEQEDQQEEEEEEEDHEDQTQYSQQKEESSNDKAKQALYKLKNEITTNYLPSDEDEDEEENNENNQDDNSENQSQQIPNTQNDINHTEDEDEEVDFYNLSEVSKANISQQNASNQKQKQDNQSSTRNYNRFDMNDEHDDDNENKGILQSSIAKVASLLDSQVQSYDKMFSSSAGSLYSTDKQTNNGKYSNDQMTKPQTEMTFGDLSDEQPSTSILPNKLVLSQLDFEKETNKSLKQQQQVASKPQYSQPSILARSNSLVQAKEIYSNPIKEECEEEQESSNFSLNYSQLSLSQNNAIQYQSANKFKLNNLERSNIDQQNQSSITGNKNLEGLLLRFLIKKDEKLNKARAFTQWKECRIKEFYTIKLKNAAMMVDKMSKFSRSFISLNSLNAILVKNRQRVLAKTLLKWVKFDQTPKQSQAPTRNSQQSEELQEKVDQLVSQLQTKDREIQKMESMFKEYSNWRSKLELIEQKMKSEVDYWKNSSDKFQKENEKLQREALRVTQTLMERTKEMESKNETIEALQKKIKQQQKQIQLDTVEEAVCQNCKNSLEESQVFSKETFVNLSNHSQDFQMIGQLNDKLSDLERQVMTYQERVHYHESVEEELKKNIEQQVDVVLKMEEERLLLLRENKETKDKNRQLIFDNEDYKSKIGMFERELEELKEQVREQVAKLPSQNDNNETEQIGFDGDTISNITTTTNQTSKNLNKENKSQNSKKKKEYVPSSKLSVTGLTKKQLQFKSSTGQKVGENSAIYSSYKLTQIPQEDPLKSKAGIEPVNKQLATDNQILTNEIITMNREISKLKAELRINSENLKKSEKERYDTSKSLESNQNALAKARKERDELFALINTDKYKNLRQLEIEKDSILKQKTDMEQQISQLKEQIASKEQFKQQDQLKLQEVEYQNQRLKEINDSREKLLQVLEDRSRKFEKDLNVTESETSVVKREMDILRQENIKMKKDIDWLTNSAKNNKLQADRAISDLESYTKILRGMEKKLAEVEVERESKETELREIRQKFMQLVQSVQQQNQIPQSHYGINQMQPPQWQPAVTQQQQQQPSVQMNGMQNYQNNIGMCQQLQQKPQQQVQAKTQYSGPPQPQQPPQRFDQNY